MADNFRTQILNNKDAASTQTPVRTLGSVTFIYLRHNDIYLLMVTRNNANVMMSLKFMTSVRRGRGGWPPRGLGSAGGGGGRGEGAQSSCMAALGGIECTSGIDLGA
jgi:hypothetical protein